MVDTEEDDLWEYAERERLRAVPPGASSGSTLRLRPREEAALASSSSAIPFLVFLDRISMEGRVWGRGEAF
jgi:hypothetical protein